MLWLDGALSSVQEDVSVKINLFASFKNVLKCTSVQRQNNVYHEISSNASILFLFYMHLYILHVFLWCRCYVYIAHHWNIFSDKFNRFCFLKHGYRYIVFLLNEQETIIHVNIYCGSNQILYRSMASSHTNVFFLLLLLKQREYWSEN